MLHDTSKWKQFTSKVPCYTSFQKVTTFLLTEPFTSLIRCSLITFSSLLSVNVASTPQVWLIKRSNTGSNFDGDSCSHASCYGEEGNGSVHCGTPLPYFESNYDTATLSSTMTNYMGNTYNNGKHCLNL